MLASDCLAWLIWVAHGVGLGCTLLSALMLVMGCGRRRGPLWLALACGTAAFAAPLL